MLFLYAIACAVAAYVLTRLLNSWALRPWRKAVNEHWTEQARLLYPARVGALYNSILLAVVLLGGRHVWFPEIENLDWAILTIIWVSGILGAYPMSKEIWPWLSFELWVRDIIRLWVMPVGFIMIYVWLFSSMPQEFTSVVWLRFSLFVAFLLWFVWWGIFPVMRIFGIVKPAPEGLRQMVNRVSQRMRVKVRGVWLWQSAFANAMAFPISSQLMFSTRLMEAMPEVEQEAVCAHELGHLTESTPVVLARVLGLLASAPLVLLVPAIHTYKLSGFLGILTFWMGLKTVSRKVAQKMEVRADTVAAEDATGTTYARALESIYRVNLIPAVMPGKKQIHPHLYDRLLAAGITPDYPRPKVARQYSVITFCLICLTAVIVAVTFFG